LARAERVKELIELLRSATLEQRLEAAQVLGESAMQHLWPP
jgi:hypothetical protein